MKKTGKEVIRNRNGITELVFILDRSGSMAGLESDSVGGFNATIKEQSEKDGKVYVSAVLFNQESSVLYDRADIGEIEPMKTEDFRVGGCTALIDAMGDAIHHIGNIHKYARAEDVPEHTVFVIMTDGMENASRRYSADKVRKMVEKKQKENGWEFLFLGANIDAVETAAHYGIDRHHSVTFESDSEGTMLNYAAVSKAVGSIRERRCLAEDWADDIKNRKKGKKGAHNN